MVDAGLSLQPKRSPRADLEMEQRLRKAELLLGSLAEADAVALGADDWALGAEWLRAEVAEQSVPVVAANLVCGTERPFPSHRVVEAGGRRIGIVGVTEGRIPGCEVEAPGAALVRAIQAVGEVDAVVGLMPMAQKGALAEALRGVKGLSVVIDATGRYSAHGPERVESTWVFGSGTRGKSLGVLQLAFVPGGDTWAPVGVADDLASRLEKLEARVSSLRGRIDREQDPKRKAAFERQLPRIEEELASVRDQHADAAGAAGTHQLRPDDRELDRSLADHPEMLARVEALNEALTRGAQAGGPPIVQRKTPDTSPYTGSEVCSACHAEQALQWSRTPHAKALSSLAADNHATDAACVGCHVTGWHQEGGPSSPADIGGFRDVQCEACHGPGRAHVAAPYEVGLVVTPPEAHCRTCHDESQDGGAFDYSAYLPKVDHGVDLPPAAPPQ